MMQTLQCSPGERCKISGEPSAAVTDLLQSEYVLIAVVLQLLVGVVNAELLKTGHTEKRG